MAPTAVDIAIISFLNAYARLWPTLDALLFRLNSSDLVKGGVLVGLLWYVWFQGDRRPTDIRRRSLVLATLVGSLLAVFLARGLQIVLPFRPRPLHDEALAFQVPFGVDAPSLAEWSSFPSDHGAMFVGLAVGLFFISRRLGACSLAYVFIVILVPRVYVGLHYPTDIAAGACLGLVSVLLAQAFVSKVNVAHPVDRWAERHPPSFYTCFFLFTFQVATLFDGLRTIVGFFV